MAPLPEPDTAQREVLALLARLRRKAGTESSEAFKLWLRTFRSVYGECFLSPGPKEETALRKLYRPPEGSSYHEILFSVHTYFAMVVRSTARRRGILLRDRDVLFDWAGDGEGRFASIKPVTDIFKSVYESLLPRVVRHAVGEYYTPDWLAETILNETGYDGDTGKRLLDPSCGTGTFLVLAIERARNRARERGEPAGETVSRILAGIQGFELNPLAALAARVNYLLALGELREAAGNIEAPVRQVDSILGVLAVEPFDFVVGNPPWIRWDYLSGEYRDATLPLWKRYGLFSLKGFDARLGGGKKDLSMLFTYACTDRYLRDGGTLGFVITEEVFKSKGAGEGFRAFRIGREGPFLRVTAAHDFTRLRPFAGVSNKTAGIVLTKGSETHYPVPYFVWSLDGQARVRRCLEARPVGSPSGPWRTTTPDAPKVPPWREGCGYRAMLGANANPYGVFWLEILDSLPEGLVSVRNLVEKGKKPVPVVTAIIEGDLVCPAVRGKDIGRWRAEPGVHVLVTQDPRTRCGYDEERMRARWPATYSYVSMFRDELLARALYRKYHAGARNPFYSQFNVAEETFSSFKVVWKRMSNDLTAAVVSHSEGPLGRRIVVPLETTAFIATGTEAEAHYLCAVLNSRAVRGFIRSFSSAGRGFGTPSVLRHIGIPAFDEQNEAHQRMADLSRELHTQMRGGDPRGQGELEAEIERCVLDPGF